ncbi:MAG TPA: outer membrane protein assembly factor BamA [Candidatus Acidoferrales bacterium]|nr:outer membrane protein assembly factor BamA [Candidatus Acidoferrales bacterium]
MRPARALGVCAWALCLFVPPLAAQRPAQPEAQPPIIERIDISGNRRIPRETLRSKIFSQEGQPYNEDRIRHDFQALWNTQYFEDIRLEIEHSPDKPNAVVLVFYVKERPMIRHIKYKGISSISESDILDRFKDRKLGLTVESAFDPTKIRRAQVLIKELLGEHGRQYATVTPEFSRIPGTNAVELTFAVKEGPKVKVGKIIFVGNKSYSDRKLLRTMHNDRPYGFPVGPFFFKVGDKTFDKRKLEEDLELGIRSFYQDNGYFTVVVKEPKLETVDVNKGGIPLPLPVIGSHHGKATNITIEIDQGERFRMGKLVVRSSDPDHPELVFKTEFLENAFPLKKGDIFSTEKVRKSLEDYKALFGNFGYIDFTAQPLTDVDQAAKVVNLTLEFDLEKPYRVRRIEFVGNTTTRDKVIRRQLLLDEGDFFNTRLWELSILRINQLNYFEPVKKEQNVDLKRNPKEGTVDITLKVREKGKQSIGLNGGISGLAGTFVGFNYQTNNFLGVGETLNFSTQFGTLQRLISFGFTEPYFRDKPLATGFTLFDSRYSFDTARETAILSGSQLPITNPNSTQNYNQDSKGFTVFASYPLKSFAFTRVGVNYGYSETNITAFSDASRLLFEDIQFTSAAGPSALNGIDQSQVTGTITYNTVNNPINPTTGKSIYFALAFVGGPLGGNVNSITPTLEYKRFFQVRKKRNVIGIRFLTAFTTGYAGKDVPPLTRLYLGGEQDVRGFDIRTITPVAFVPTNSPVTINYVDPTTLGSNGLPVTRQLSVPILTYQFSYPGGDFEAVGNFEYRIPIYKEYVGISYFLDVGVNGILQRDQLRLNPSGLANLQTAFPTLPISDNIPLAQNSNFYPRSSTGLELVVQLPIIQVPFRIYYAYNVSRYSEIVQPPRGEYYLSDAVRATLPPGVLVQQVLPQLNYLLDQNSKRLLYSEPLHTIRFTVARTF